MNESKAARLALHTFDPDIQPSSPAHYADVVVDQVLQAWESGSDLVLLPEFTWMGLESLLSKTEKEPLKAIAKVFWTQLFPKIRERLSNPNKAVVLGTVPALTESGTLRNRAPILVNGLFVFQDKLHLTPWESSFEPGDSLLLWNFKGLRIAVVICLDIEIPELSAKLRDAKVDLILCPSATETLLGVERINRCASARAVELGCYVGVSHLTGTSDSALIDISLGCAAFYCPSQSAFKENPRTSQTLIHEHGHHSLTITADKYLLDLARRMHVETNPANLGRKAAGCERIIRIDTSLIEQTQTIPSPC